MILPRDRFHNERDTTARQMSDAPLEPLRFDDFELDEANARLTRAGQPIQLPPKAFGVLCTLVRHAGRLITKDALLDAVRGHQHVSESVLKTTISQVRAALTDDAGKPRYIETAARRGYRFIAAARAASAPPAVAAVASQGSIEPRAPEVQPGMIGRRSAIAKLNAAWQL